MEIFTEKGIPITLGQLEISEDSYQLIGMRRVPCRKKITGRERQVASFAGRGLPDKAIALKLGISIHTVITHLRRVYGKLGISSRVSLAHYPFGAG